MPTGRSWLRRFGLRARAAGTRGGTTASFFRRCIFHGSQHHLASVARSLALEQRLEAVLAAGQRGVFEAMLALLAGMSGTAHLVQMVDSTIVRAHVSAAGAKGGRKGKLSVAHAAASPPKST